MIFMKTYGIVYKAINLINNKIYVGQTTKNFEEYKDGHIKSALKGRNQSKYFYNALRKYGEENFKWETIKKCTSKKQLLAKEKFYIKKYKSYIPEFGYNLTLGGEGESPNKKVREKISIT